MENVETNNKFKELIMEMVNGKLINQKTNQFEEIAQQIYQVNQRCEYLESQLTNFSGQNSLQYLQKLEQKIRLLEKVTSKQSKQLSFIKISSIIALVCLCLLLGTNNQSEDDNSRLQKQRHLLVLTKL